MFQHEYVRHCPGCDELTAHCRRAVAIPVLLGSACLLGAGLLLTREGLYSIGGWLLMFPALYLFH